MPDIVVAVPLPDVITAPGILVTVHVPEAGNPVRGILPVATEHVGCVAVPVTGADGVTGCGFIVIEDVAIEVHPDEFVTVYV